MTRFVVDAGVVIHLASAGIQVSPEHELLAPTLLRSETLSRPATHPASLKNRPPRSAPSATAVHTTVSLPEEAASRHRSFAHRTMSS